MGIFDFKKRKDFVDLRKYKQPPKQPKTSEIQIPAETKNETNSTPFSFFNSSAFNSNSEQETQDYPSQNETEEKRKKLVKRLMDLTDKIESLSNQIYHLQQRVELLEKKSGVGSFG